VKRRGFHDDEERNLITAYESGEFRPVKDQQKAKQTAIRRAAEEGLPYQSLIASVLHKYVSGSAPSGNQGG